jgi:hypothetical protein
MGSIEVSSNDTFAALERYNVRIDDSEKDVSWVVSGRIGIMWQEKLKLISAGRNFVQTLSQASDQGGV